MPPERTVLFIDVTHIDVGGVGVRQTRLANGLPSRGWRPFFALTQGRRFHNPARYLRSLSAFDHCLLDGRSGSVDGRRLAIQDVLNRVRPDVVLPGAVLDAWAVVEKSKSADGPRVVYGLPGVDVNALSFLSRHAGGIDAGFGVGPLTERLLRDFCNLHADRTFLVPTGVPLCIRPSSTEVARPIRLLYVGRFDPDKRALDAIALADELRSRNLDFRLTLVGSGLYSGEFREAESRHHGKLILHDPVPSTTLYERFYPDADAILMFSAFEGLPNALLEGMAHAVVPITSDFRGRNELGLFHSRQTALVFDVGNMSQAAERIQELATTEGLKELIGTRARRLIEDERGVDRMVDAFVQVLNRAIKGPARVGAIEAIPERGKSRLRRFVGPRAAERLRRILRVNFEHVDAGEWPLINSIVSSELDSDLGRLRELIGDESLTVPSAADTTALEYT
jgi:glycosyltransferase involved in cell wall biosynthesis